ncbi:hypothetical protein KC19_4G245800 [Ceratodon purpureus]|uniref:Uncharacterized protein n=1 Tax=Ceratodon purpureus TaxID=3225 RepID=A0A8T0IFQ4_CERPU|nr:hypothetical protein KC19_4G245800 [Ceratodon purpureus]
MRRLVKLQKPKKAIPSSLRFKTRYAKPIQLVQHSELKPSPALSRPVTNQQVTRSKTTTSLHIEATPKTSPAELQPSTPPRRKTPRSNPRTQNPRSQPRHQNPPKKHHT